jgi:hypothetical protein
MALLIDGVALITGAGALAHPAEYCLFSRTQRLKNGPEMKEVASAANAAWRTQLKEPEV